MRILLLSVLSLLLLGCNYNNTEDKNNKIEPKISDVNIEQDIGTDMVILDYASDNKIIFHGYFGLFVYDLNEEKMLQSIDLKEINCNYTQGDDACIVTVNQEGSELTLHPISSEEMYVYNILDNKLEKVSYVEIDNPFKLSEAPTDINEKNYSYISASVKFSNGELGYLAGYDMTLGSLRYVRGDKEYIIFK